MLRKYYKVKLMMLDTNQEDKKFKSKDMLDILLNANLKELDEIIVYKSFSGVFKELITHEKIPAIVEEILPYSKNEHSYDLITHQPVFFFCNTSLEEDKEKKYVSLDNLEATKQDVELYLNKYLDVDSKGLDPNSLLAMRSTLDTIFSESREIYNKILKDNGLVKNKVKKKERKEIKNIISSQYNL